MLNKISGGIAAGTMLILSATTPAHAFSHSRHSIMTHGLAAAAGGMVGYLAGRSSNEHEYYQNQTVVTQQPSQVIVTQQPPIRQGLTDCSITRRAPEMENDGYEHVVFIKDCIVNN